MTDLEHAVASKERYIAHLRDELRLLPVEHPLSTEYRVQLANLILSTRQQA